MNTQLLNYCECGCGEHVSDGRRFKRGHNSKRVGPVPEPPNPSGLCLCGCGGKAPIAKQTSNKYGHVRGHPVKYRPGHSVRGLVGDRNSQWKGGRIVTGEGYIKIRRNGGYVYEHRAVMENILGRKMLATEQVHHLNGKKDDNRPENLELWVRSQPNGIRSDGERHCPTCQCTT